MKSFLILFSLCANLLLAQSFSRFQISGTIAGIDRGKLLLLAQTPMQKYDTLSVADFEKGRFILSGQVATPTMARLFVEGYGQGFPMVVEAGGSYEAHLSNEADYYLRGGTLHQAWSDFQTAHAQRVRYINRMIEQRDSLRQLHKFRSVSVLNDSIRRLGEMNQSLHNAFYAQHQEDVLGAAAIYEEAVQKEWSLSAMKQAYSHLGKGAQNSPSGQLLQARITRMASTESGKIAPDFTLTSITGESISLSQIKAKIKILDFWASWCGPCRLNHPALRQLYAAYKEKGLEIIAVSLDENATVWRKAVEKDQITWLQLSSLKGWKCPVAALYNVTALPDLLVLDANNRIIAHHLRGEALQQFIHQQLTTVP